MGIVEISDGVSTRRIRIDDLQGRLQVDCSGDEATVVVPEGTEVDRDPVTSDAAGGDPDRAYSVRR